ncbi:MAG TPA: FtsX-like permease family protein, partial [Gemmatimonadaceae bacterium]|nr:FtsX-like permease family protein [Gemmatimonadaceae bacterium]
EVSVSRPALAFTLAVTVLAGVAMGLAPALQTLPSSLDSTLRASDRSSTSGSGMALGRRWLVVGELALSVALVTAAGLLLRSYAELRQIRLGFHSDGVLAVDVTLPEAAYNDPARTTHFYRQLREQLSARPSVLSAGLVSDIPLRSWPSPDDIRIEGRPEPAPGEQGYNAGFYMISPGFRETLRIPLVQGRDLNDGDVEGAARVALVNAAAARAFWPGETALGRRIRYYGADSGWITVVGIVGDTRYRQVDEEPRPAIYTAHAQLPRRGSNPGHAMTLVVRSDGNPESVMPAIREIVGTLDPEVPLASVTTMDEVVGGALGRPRFAMVLMSFFAGAALLLGALGIYGVVSFMVQQRTREIGIRVALGANPWQVRKLVMRESVQLLLVGAGLGLALTLALGRTISSLLYGVSAIDPITLVAVVPLLALVVMLASYLPARRATGVDPLIAVRAE